MDLDTKGENYEMDSRSIKENNSKIRLYLYQELIEPPVFENIKRHRLQWGEYVARSSEKVYIERNII